MKPLISYYGGKQRLASKLLPLLPPHTVYVEPFAGGASLLFAKPIPDVTNNDRYREVLNDKNDLIVTMYRVTREYPGRLHELLELTPYSASEWKKAKEICRNPINYTQIEIAWAVIVNCQQSFAKDMNAGWGTSVCDQNQSATWSNYRQALPEILKRLEKVYIDSTDAIACIDRWDSPQTCFYVDPPYPGTAQGHYSGYTQEDFDRLIAKLQTIQGSFLLSCYENQSPLKSWEKFEFNATMSAAKSNNSDKTKTGERRNSDRVEVVWRKLSTIPHRKELKLLTFNCSGLLGDRSTINQ